MALEIPQFQAPDFAGPIAAAMAAHERKQNAETQRMFAENQMRRQSAQDLRQQHEDEERDKENERRHGIEQAQALGTIQQTLRTNPGVAMALGNAYGIDVHPLLSTTQAAQPEPTQIDTSTQALPSNAGSNDLDPAGMGAPPEQQTGDPSDADLEGLMRRASGAARPASSDAVERELAGSREESQQATPLLYEAAIGPRKYQLNAKPVSAFGDQKYDAQVQRFVDNGMDLAQAQKLVLAQKEKDDNAQAVADRTRAAIDQRGDQQREIRNEFSLTADQRLQENERNRVNSRDIATGHDRAHLASAGMNAGLRAGEQSDKKQEKEDQTAVRDESGNVIGHVPTGRGGAQGFATRDADYGRAIDQLQALADHVKKHGDRVGPMHAKDRDTLYNNAAIGVATVSPLGKTNESVELEKGSIGNSGVPSIKHPMDVVMGANLPAIENKIREMKEQRERYRKQTLIPTKLAQPGPRKLSQEEISGGNFLP